MALFALLAQAPLTSAAALHDAFGGYHAWWKPIPLLVVLLLWTRLLTWIDKDAKRVLLPRFGVNSGLLGGLAAALLLFFVLPGYPVALGAFLFLFVASVGVYLTMRSQKAGLDDVKDELLREFGIAKLLGRMGGGGKDDAVRSAAGEVALIGKPGTMTRPDEEDPNRLPFDVAQQILGDPMVRGAQTIEVLPGKEMASSRYWVDGVAYEGAQLDRSQAAAAIALFKRMAALDVDERRKPQAGVFKLQYEGKKHEARLSTKGGSVGETATLEVDVPSRYQFRPEGLGLTAEQLIQLTDGRDEPGVVLLAMPKGQGLTALQYAMIRLHDAFTSHIVTLERDPPIDMEGITQNKLDAGAPPAEESKQVSWIISQEPDILMAGQLEASQSAKDVVDLAAKGRRVYVGVRAGDAFEAVDAWRRLVNDDAVALKQLTLVIAGRSFRRLCDETKIPYVPNESLLKQLRLKPDVATELYKPSFGNVVDEKGHEVPDTICWGMGYRGRFGVYEVFAITDEARAAIRQGASASQLRQLFRKQKNNRHIQELAVARVQLGDTSVEEFLRVLKGEQASSSSRSSSSGDGDAEAPAPSSSRSKSSRRA